MSIDVIAEATAGPFAAACVVLVFAGLSKLRQPLTLRPAATALGLPASPGTVRTLGIIELATAGAALAIGGVAAAVVAIVYAALAVAAWRLFVRAPGTACGCLGTTEAPVTVGHVVVNIAFACTAALATAAGSPLTAVSDGVWSRIAFVTLIGCCAWLVTLVLEEVPALNAAVRQGGSG